MTPKVLLEVKAVSKRFGGITALDDVSLTVTDEHSFWGIVGPNGSGKTTLFNVVSRVYPPSSGTVAVSAAGSASKGARIGRTFQHPRVFPTLTVAENLMAVSRGMKRRNSHDRASELVEIMGLALVTGRRAGELSIGQQKLVELARSLMHSPKLVLLDEVAAGIHPHLVEEIGKHLHALAEAGTTFLIIEHDMKFLMELSSHVFVLNQGRLLTEGTPDDVTRNPEVAAVYLGANRG